MIKLLKTSLVIATLCAAVQAQTSNLSASLEAGYGSTYIVNGIAKTKEVPFVGFNIGKSYYGVDFSMGGTLLPTNNGFEESHWQVSAGKSLDLGKGFALQGVVEASRHQTALTGAPNSTETALKFALNNKYLTPYVKGSYDLDLDQLGYIVGVEKSVNVKNWFTVTPAVEYGQFTDYDTFAAKIGVSKTFGHLTAFAEGAYRDNNFQVAKYNFAQRELNGEFLGTGGLRWQF